MSYGSILKSLWTFIPHIRTPRLNDKSWSVYTFLYSTPQPHTQPEVLLLEHCLKWDISAWHPLTASSGRAVSLTWPTFSRILHWVIPAEFRLYLPVPFARGMLWTFQSSSLSIPAEPFKYSTKDSTYSLPICITHFQSCLNKWFWLDLFQSID